ncbi:acetyltransferase [Citromicrobium sp. RCC1885]|uniref:GNAT family N-acetyltransferase n=1 Tax=unclassified Citromicrobium TaxID=2630544 RepID=UPI0006C91A45|nr:MULTISPECIES: GNAT family N-acetyltransferase [unclassified Citromicrobium]MAO04489.1 N-acetyltransferase [Citromicrobium sp.]KPM13193.1 acetyltransferase [Citromicrobium sp. WPS32]KPM21347.1 acetyltransferase [Citromicrobium sp. RCC1885]KPM29427.1 acetyltransferase [Citromicrobium sp. RCC1878]MAY76121.1 N-acetyltransferase [Citromicrobium sp.]|tara:strand:+ start:11290 stop:11592 length:303 start_codon:yes stop_codon:yes gene_type:complete
MGTATITHHVVGQGGKYIAHLEGEDAKGTLEWEPGDEVDGKEVRIATHTLVPEAIGGRGVAALLVERLVADARKQDFLIRPDCSYVAKKFEENDWDAVRA